MLLAIRCLLKSMIRFSLIASRKSSLKRFFFGGLEVPPGLRILPAPSSLRRQGAYEIVSFMHSAAAATLGANRTVTVTFGSACPPLADSNSVSGRMF